MVDETILKVRGDKNFINNRYELKLYIKKLSFAILAVLEKHGQARLKTVGASSINNAVKSIIIATNEASKKGMNLVTIPSFDKAEFDGEEKTAIIFLVEDSQIDQEDNDQGDIQ